MDIFRVFDSLNDIDQLKFGIGALPGCLCQCLCLVCALPLGWLAVWLLGLRKRDTVNALLKDHCAACQPADQPLLHFLPPPPPPTADTVRAAGGVIEGTLCYTGDVSNPRASKYTLEYYLNLAGAYCLVHTA